MTNARIYLAHTMTPEQALRAVDRDHGKVRRRGSKPAPWALSAYQRRKELRRLAWYRISHRLAIGPEAGWATVIANTLRIMTDVVTSAMVRDEALSYRLPPIPDAVLDEIAAQFGGQYWRRPKLLSPAAVGAYLEVTSVERDEARLRKIDAVDESADDRRRRLGKERKARQRAALAALRKGKKSMAERARELGVSRATLYRLINAGKVEP